MTSRRQMEIELSEYGTGSQRQERKLVATNVCQDTTSCMSVLATAIKQNQPGTVAQICATGLVDVNQPISFQNQGRTFNALPIELAIANFSDISLWELGQCNANIPRDLLIRTLTAYQRQVNSTRRFKSEQYLFEAVYATILVAFDLLEQRDPHFVQSTPNPVQLAQSLGLVEIVQVLVERGFPMNEVSSRDDHALRTSQLLSKYGF